LALCVCFAFYVCLVIVLKHFYVVHACGWPLYCLWLLFWDVIWMCLALVYVLSFFFRLWYIVAFLHDICCYMRWLALILCVWQLMKCYMAILCVAVCLWGYMIVIGPFWYMFTWLWFAPYCLLAFFFLKSKMIVYVSVCGPFVVIWLYMSVVCHDIVAVLLFMICYVIVCGPRVCYVLMWCFPLDIWRLFCDFVWWRLALILFVWPNSAMLYDFVWFAVFCDVICLCLAIVYVFVWQWLALSLCSAPFLRCDIIVCGPCVRFAVFSVMLYDCAWPLYMCIYDCGWPLYCVWPSGVSCDMSVFGLLYRCFVLPISACLYDCVWPFFYMSLKERGGLWVGPLSVFVMHIMLSYMIVFGTWVWVYMTVVVPFAVAGLFFAITCYMIVCGPCVRFLHFWRYMMCVLGLVHDLMWLWFARLLLCGPQCDMLYDFVWPLSVFVFARVYYCIWLCVALVYDCIWLWLALILLFGPFVSEMLYDCALLFNVFVLLQCCCDIVWLWLALVYESLYNCGWTLLCCLALFCLRCCMIVCGPVLQVEYDCDWPLTMVVSGCGWQLYGLFDTVPWHGICVWLNICFLGWICPLLP